MKSKNTMNDMNQILAVIKPTLSIALTVSLLLFSMFFALEPKIGQAVDSGPFTIQQTIGDEISFLVDAPNVTMSGPLNGLTGGTGNGSTTAVVLTNSATGYTMTIAFADNGTANAMLGDTTASESILDYGSGAEPDFSFSTASSSAVFGYTVSADNNSDLDASFLDNGSTCNSGSGFTADRCWMGPATTTFQIIDRSSSAATGATTTVSFRVYVPNSPNPSLTADTYTATATLTAVNQ